jgi:hypothetical protein
VFIIFKFVKYVFFAAKTVPVPASGKITNFFARTSAANINADAGRSSSSTVIDVTDSKDSDGQRSDGSGNDDDSDGYKNDDDDDDDAPSSSLSARAATSQLPVSQRFVSMVQELSKAVDDALADSKKTIAELEIAVEEKQAAHIITALLAVNQCADVLVKTCNALQARKQIVPKAAKLTVSHFSIALYIFLFLLFSV